MTWAVHPGTVPPREREAVLRRIHHWILTYGLDAAELEAWRLAACPFPALRDAPEVLAVRACVEDRLHPSGQPCEPQIVCAWPAWSDWTFPPPHIDQPPPWSGGRPYSVIAGVALTDQTPANGCLHMRGARRPQPVRLRAGDMVTFSPDEPHSAGLNTSGSIRWGLYLRWVALP